jgi:hypothetical protein
MPSRSESLRALADSALLMRSELSIVLNAKPHHRVVLRHLVFFEAALSKKGLRALDEIPIKTLQRARDQLQLLAESVASRDLATLADRMSQSIVRRAGVDDTKPESSRSRSVLT